MSKTNKNKQVVESAVSKRANEDSSKKSATDTRFKSLKYYAIGLSLIVIVSVFVLNAIFDGLFSKSLTFDLSGTAQNTISSVTQNYLDSLPAETEIRIVGLMDKPESLAGTPYEYIVPLLDDYAFKSNGKVTVEYINPKTYPTIIAQLDPDSSSQISDGMYVIKCGDRITTLIPSSCFTYDQNVMAQYGYYLPTSNVVESSFTNAIVAVTTDMSNKAYFITGLQEDPHTSFSNILSSLLIESVDLPVSDSFAIPEDCDLLILSGPNVDIPTNVADALISFLSNGGKLIVSTDFYYNSAEHFNNLNRVLNSMNLNIDYSLISENDPSYSLVDGGFEFLGTVTSDYASLVSSPTLRVSYARPVRQIDSTLPNIVVTPLIYSTQNASLSTVVDEQLTSGSVTGQFNIAMKAVNGSAGTVYVFGTNNFTSDVYISTYGFNDANVELTREVVRGMLNVNSSIIVDSKTFADYSINDNLSTGSGVSVLATVFLIVIPFGFVVTAAVVYKKRKNL